MRRAVLAIVVTLMSTVQASSYKQIENWANDRRRMPPNQLR